MRKALGWILVFALLGLFIGLLGCNYVPVLAVDIPNEGRTLCDLAGHPVVLLNRQVIGQPEEHFARIHEFVHVRQLSSDCQRFMLKAVNNPSFRIQEELEAYCIEGQERIRYGWNPDTVKFRIKDIMATIYQADTAKMNCAVQPP